MCDLRDDVANMVKVDLPVAIKRLAVKDESTLVYLIKLSKMTQSPGTGIRSFVASLRGQAALCQYVAPLHVWNQDVLMNSTSVKRSSTTTW